MFQILRILGAMNSGLRAPCHEIKKKSTNVKKGQRKSRYVLFLGRYVSR